MICRRCGSRIPEHLAVRESFKCPECGRQFGTPAPEREPVYEPRSHYSSRDDRYADDSRAGRYAEEPRSRYATDRYAEEPRSRYASDRYAEEPRSRYASDRYAEEPRSSRRASSRFEPEYDDRYADDGYYDDGYYDDGQQYADGGYYDDDQYADDGYYDDGQQYADDGYYYDDGQGYADDGQQYADDGYYADDGGCYDDNQEYYPDEPQYSDDDLSDLIGGGKPRPAGMKLTTVLVVVILGVLALIAVFCIDAAIHPEEASASNMPAVGSTQNADGQYPAV